MSASFSRKITTLIIEAYAQSIKEHSADPEKRSNAILEAALEGARQEAKPKWISVTEFPAPPQCKAILVKNEDGESEDEREPVVGFLEDHFWYQTWSRKRIKVTHWMPLPK